MPHSNVANVLEVFLSLYLVCFLLLFVAGKSFAGSCCGQSMANFTVLHKYEPLNINLSTTVSETLGRVRNDSKLYYEWGASKKRTAKNTTLSLASSFAEHWQWWATTSFVDVEYAERGVSEKFNDFSDSLIGLNYEILPEYSYHPLKPVVFVSFLLNLPTGQSAFDEGQLTEGAGVTGHNQYGLGFGVTLYKVWLPWQLKIQARSLRLLEKDFDNSEVSSFFDHSFANFVTYHGSFWDLS